MIYWSEDRKFVEREFVRMGFDKDARWRISDINKDFELCNTYPRFLIVPSNFKDEDLETVAKFRYFRRIPTAVWRHTKNGCFIVRSSQPTVGWFGWFRSELDENLVQAYVNNTMPPTSCGNGEKSTIKQQTTTTTSSNQIDSSVLHADRIPTADSGTREEPKPVTIKNLCDQDETIKGCETFADRTPATVIRKEEALTTKSHLEESSQLANDNLKDPNYSNNNLLPTDTTKNLPSPNLVTSSASKPENQNDTAANTTNLDRPTTNGTADMSERDADRSVTPKPSPVIISNGKGSSPPATENNSSVKDANNITSIGKNNSTSAPITTAPSPTTSKMLIIDARSYTAAMANRAKGGGCECSEYYQRCEVHFMNLANIHSIRKSYHAIRSVCEAYSEQSNNWVSFLDNSRWLHHISGLLKSALLVVDTIDIEEKSILIHCSDGWDRTPQLVALAEIMLDPHYRTFDGFRTLIQREWLDFGHKFADRCGSNPCNEDPNERCPVFLQWLDCVQQLIVQYPTHFEFNSLYLDKLHRHTYSNVFGTFSYNSTQERILSRVDDKVLSLWSYFDSSRKRFRNENHIQSQEILRPSSKVRDLHFWKEVYLPPISNQNPYLPITTNNIDNKKFYDSLYIDGLTRTVCK